IQNDQITRKTNQIDEPISINIFSGQIEFEETSTVELYGQFVNFEF
ncbi:unnamed protein product, partial [Rotaria sp. Silwood1]